MSNPYVGEIRMFGGNFAPSGWNFCDGSLLSIANYATLFNLIGTTYGGDGQNTFAVPDLRGRIPVHQGNGYVIGQLGGTETVTLTVSQIPAHAHTANGNSTGSGSPSPSGAVWGNWSDNQFTSAGATGQMNGAALGNAGGNQPHDNLMPYLCVNFIISLFGIYPSQN